MRVGSRAYHADDEEVVEEDEEDGENGVAVCVCPTELNKTPRGPASVRLGSRAYHAEEEEEDNDDDEETKLPSSRSDREDMSESKDETELKRPEQQINVRRTKAGAAEDMTAEQ